jgi:hypothetical protein
MMHSGKASERASQWRQDAEVLRRYGQEPIAAVIEKLATEIEMDAQHNGHEGIGMNEAVRLSGYSAAHLRRLVRERKLRNLGTAKKPQFLRSEIPRKPGYTPDNNKLASDSAQPHLSRYKQVARAVVQRRTNDGAD